MCSASNDDGRGSSSRVMMAVLFNTSRTIDSDTGRKAVNGDPSKTVRLTGGRGTVWELSLSRIVEICPQRSHKTSADEVRVE